MDYYGRHAPQFKPTAEHDKAWSMAVHAESGSSWDRVGPAADPSPLTRALAAALKPDNRVLFSKTSQYEYPKECLDGQLVSFIQAGSVLTADN
jgi:hypothetical protein